MARDSAFLLISSRGCAALAALCVLGCGSSENTTLQSGPTNTAGAASTVSNTGAAGGGGSAAMMAASNSGEAGASGGAGATSEASCAVQLETHPPTSANHLPVPCEPTDYSTNPPSGGDHYAIWAAFQNYDFAVPDGFLGHSLEHGAVVYWYNCPDGCADEVASAESFIAALPSDALCEGNGADRRVILVPHPSLPTRWAASSWGYTLTSDCFDTDAMQSFYAAHYGNGREQLCAAGLVVTPQTCP
ncbi:MAG TPA: DUF3105 domain-containing protein [Polyangiaceae bacterium]|nr:DUF3105 domain-containing protein [Polyangiaceae bacterium]